MSSQKAEKNTESPVPILGHFIDGKAVSDQRRTSNIFNPATGQITKEVSMAGGKTYEMASSAAKRAFPAWRNTPPQKRAQIMFAFKRLLEVHADEICAMITSEHGKVLDDARGELGRGIEVVEYACGISELLKGEFSKNAGPAIDSWSEFQPLGVAAGITPFNFPVMVPMWMLSLIHI